MHEHSAARFDSPLVYPRQEGSLGSQWPIGSISMRSAASGLNLTLARKRNPLVCRPSRRLQCFADRRGHDAVRRHFQLQR